MPLTGIPLKVKLVGIVVLAVLTFSLVGTTLGVVNGMAQEDADSTALASNQLVSPTDRSSDGPADNALATTFKFVCPFH